MLKSAARHQNSCSNTVITMKKMVLKVILISVDTETRQNPRALSEYYV
jgi:hypothetical protein